ncbi:hypothetical protein BDN71DRAFT_1563627 [Pleurotus eryngii]|uniref:Uncharacterized protein n=1 Tax=Pleurotus eryngii TaxID=5323 RepID=A0A9P6DFH9_PLEER|nr:hypothetical protein BDN71DRAFT_1563627 [Pleurotus eryngii]
MCAPLGLTFGLPGAMSCKQMKDKECKCEIGILDNKASNKVKNQGGGGEAYAREGGMKVQTSSATNEYQCVANNPPEDVLTDLQGVELFSTSACGGKTVAGRRIDKVYPELRTQLQQVVLEFGTQIISVEKCMVVSLPGTKPKKNYKMPSSSADPTSQSSTSKEDAVCQLVLKKLFDSMKYTVLSKWDDSSSAGSIDKGSNMSMDLSSGSGDDDDDGNNGDKDSPPDECSCKYPPEADGGEWAKIKALDTELEGTVVPPWLETVVEYLRCFKGHPSWLDVLLLFVKFKHHISPNLGKGQPLAATGCPSVLNKWIHNGCHPHKHCKLNTEALKGMVEELRIWWVFLQPSLSIPADFNNSSSNISLFLCPELNVGDWYKLYQGAVNGIYGVLVCLRWWMEAGLIQGSDFDDIIANINTGICVDSLSVLTATDMMGQHGQILYYDTGKEAPQAISKMVSILFTCIWTSLDTQNA